MAKGTRKAATATLPQTNHTEDIPHEVVNTTPALLSPEDEIKRELAKFNIADARIAELKQMYAGLTIAKDGLDKVREGRSVARNLRTGVEKKRKELKEDILVMGRAIDGEAKRLTGLLAEIEDPLDAEIKAEEEKREKAKREAEEAAQKKLQGRVSELLENGMQFNGSYYAIGDTVTIDVVTLKNFSDEQFTGLLNRVKSENLAIQEAKEAERRKVEEERLEFERQKQEQAEKEKQLREQQESQERERQQLIADRRELRAGLLESLGFVYKQTLQRWEFGEERLMFGDLGAIETEAWKGYYSQATTASNREKENQARRKAEAKMRETRISEMKGIGYELQNGNFFIVTDTFGQTNFCGAEAVLRYDEEGWGRFVNDASNIANQTRRRDADEKQKKADREKQEATELEERKEAERLARLSDTEKVKEFLAKVSAVMHEAPKVEDSATASVLGGFMTSVSEAHITAEKSLQNL